ncbi:MAG: XVIPCD domain-containing protein [Pseudomonadota bacterium]
MNAQFDPDRHEARQVFDPLSGQTFNRPSFADEVRGTAPKDIDITLAHLARDVYTSDDRQRGDTAQFRPLTDEQFRQVGIDPALRSNNASGFDADIYGDGQGRYVLAFRGTDAGKDWGTNLGQGLGFETAQYNQAVMLSRQAKVAFGDELVITGHSLGGGLAAVGAAATDTPAVTFNAAGVKDKTLERIGLDASAVKEEATHGQIRRYAVDNEILTGLQERNIATRYLMPDAMGHKIELPDPDPQGFWQRVNPIQSVKHSVQMHSMDSVITAQEKFFGYGLRADATMTHQDHPFHAPFQRNFDQLQPALQQQGLDMRQSQNVAGALTLAAHREGVNPETVSLSNDGGRAFAVQGQQPETQRYSHVEVNVSMQTPLIESSRQAVELGQTQTPTAPQQNAPQQAAPQMELNQDQAAPTRGAR